MARNEARRPIELITVSFGLAVRDGTKALKRGDRKDLELSWGLKVEIGCCVSSVILADDVMWSANSLSQLKKMMIDLKRGTKKTRIEESSG